MKRNLAIIVIVVILVGILAAASRTPSQNATTTQTTIGEIPSGGNVTVGQPFIMTGTDSVPVQVNFTSAFFALHFSSGFLSYVDAAPPDKLFVLRFQMRNVGVRTTTAFSSVSNWDVVVDSGYIYQPALDFNLTGSLDPQQTITSGVVFKILATTTPVEVRFYDTCPGSTADCSPTYTVDLIGVSIPPEEELTLPSSLSCFFYNGTLNLLNVTNSGLASVTIVGVYYSNQLVSSNPATIQPGETVSMPITIPSTVQPGSGQYEIKVLTSQGNTFTSSCYYEGS